MTHYSLFVRLSQHGGVPVLAALPGILLLQSGCKSVHSTAPPVGAAAAQTAARFVDVTDAAGIRYEWKIPGKRPLTILQTIGNGCAFFDYNNDGNLDILLVGPKLGLYQGDGKGRFVDVTAATGLGKLSGHFLGCAVGDINADGYDDLYISGYRTGLLLRNEPTNDQRPTTNDPGASDVRRSPFVVRQFRDVTRQAGLKPQPWGTSCGFVETVPGSGRLDLYICNYAVFGPDTVPQLCNESGVMTSCGPRYYKPYKGVLYRQEATGRFTDATRAAGATTVGGKGLGVAFADFDDRGRPGIAIANDEMPGDLMQPLGDRPEPRYVNIGEMSGTAYDRDGNVHGGMGVDWGDYDNDGRFDLFVATFQNESKSLYHNDGKGRFSDLGLPTGIGVPTAPYVAFGCKFGDFDNDGWLDLIIANGHVQDNIQQISPNTTYRQSTQLFRNRGDKPVTFEDVSATSRADLQRPIVGRGLAVGDYDNDGRIDVLVVDSEGKPLLLHNETGERRKAKGESPNTEHRSPTTGNWLGVRLVGTKSNRNGYGAVLTAQIGGRTLTRQCQSAGSYLSASDPRVHFGLGAAVRVEALSVRWPSGRTDTFQSLTANRYITLREGNPSVIGGENVTTLTKEGR